MNNMDNLTERLVTAAHENKVLYEEIGEALHDIAKQLANILDGTGVMRFAAHGILLDVSGYPCTNDGCMGPALWVDDGGYGHELLSTTGEPDSWFQLFGDINSPIHRAGRAARRRAALAMPEFLDALASYLEEHKPEKAAETIRRIAQCQK